MNDRQKELYTNLMKLCDSTEVFFFVDQEREGAQYRIFSYRLGSYTDFCLPDARKCRGTMFEISPTGEPTRLASLPFDKFFNVGENPFTMNPDWAQTDFIATKVDGSLISTYLIHGGLGLKSKASLASQQALDAENWIYEPENEAFFDDVLDATKAGFTVIMEWTAPNNRIVLPYDKQNLTVLGVRSNYNGGYVTGYGIRQIGWKHIFKNMAQRHDVGDVADFAALVHAMENIEGFVFTMKDGEMLKLKTQWYLQRHRLKDGIQHARHLFEAIINENVDDAKVLFKDDPQTMGMIKAMEDKVIPKFNHMIAQVGKFYEDNKLLSRKDYAILAQSQDDGYMGLKMNAYLGRPNDYKAFAVKNYKDFIGEVTDTTIED